ncbi:hypothetical protein BH11PSE7_BH11PSE7_02960 [soil metagenome]
MFDRIKKVFSKDKEREPEPGPASSQMPHTEVSQWAGTQGFAFSGQGTAFALDGKVGNKTWRMERGRPSRNFIRGEELRGRCELGIDENISVLIMNRPLKQALEKKAYQLYTDSLQTTADPNLPEEMRWLAMYDEVGWESLPLSFWDRYSVLTDEREHAIGWVDPILAGLMMKWPEPGPSAEVPFMLMLLRGKAYLRMEYTPADMATLQHAATIFTMCCESAMNGLADIAL